MKILRILYAAPLRPQHLQRQEFTPALSHQLVSKCILQWCILQYLSINAKYPFYIKDNTVFAAGRPWTDVLIRRAQIEYLSADRYRVDNHNDSISKFNTHIDNMGKHNTERKSREQEFHALRMEVLSLKKQKLEMEVAVMENKYGFVHTTVAASRTQPGSERVTSHNGVSTTGSSIYPITHSVNSVFKPVMSTSVCASDRNIEISHRTSTPACVSDENFDENTSRSPNLIPLNEL